MLNRSSINFFSHHKKQNVWDQNTTSVERLISKSDWRRYYDVGTTSYLGRWRRNQNPTYLLGNKRTLASSSSQKTMHLW